MSMASPSVRGYRFGVFEVDLASASVRREGLQVRMRGKPFDILVFLLERPEEIFSREDLRQRLWAADTFVDFDHGLNAAVNRLRDALGDSAENPRFIQTMPRRGYRFIAPVERVAQPPVFEPPPAPTPAEPATPRLPAPVASRWSRPIAAAIVAVAAAGLLGWRYRRAAGEVLPGAGRHMVAVLPFENLSGDPEQNYFSQGITEELIAQLGALNPQALGVIARTTTARYADGDLSIRDIGRTLGVEYVLEGSVRRSGPQVRITAQLIDASRQTQLWSETYDHEIGDVLLTQRDVAMRVAEALSMSVLGTRAVPRMRSAAAYEAYLRGRYLRQQGTHESLARALKYFEEAIAHDPTYAAAYAGLADVHHVLGGPGWEFGSPGEILPLALQAANRAIELDPQLPDGYAVRGMSRLWLDWDSKGAEQDLRRAVALNASFAQAHQYLSTALVVQGRTDEAIAAARRAAELDPLSPTAGTTLGYRFYYAGRYQEALQQFARVIELAPSYGSARLGQAQTYRELGRSAESFAALQRAVAVAGGRTYIQSQLAFAQAARGRPQEARAILKELQEIGLTRYVAPYNLALVAAGLGDRAAVRAHLERAFADRSGWMLFVPLEREFAPYRDELAGLLARVLAAPKQGESGRQRPEPGTGPEVVSRAR
jgi:TolB-like protein/DNA-binding winged helix-turn-helix (wHTH) protein/tetratricopeptide (TPR) repeat protein